MPYFDLSVTEDSITVFIEDSEEGYHRIYWRLASERDARYIDVWGGPSFDYTIDGLSSGTQYAVNVRLPDQQTQLGTQYATTDGPPAPKRPDNWRWRSIIETGKPVAISADEWNDFTDRIDEFLEYVGLGPSYCTQVYTNDLIADWIVNQAINGVNKASGSRISNVNAGDKIEARLFLNMESALNSIP